MKKPTRNELINTLKRNPMQTMGYGEISQHAIDYIEQIEYRLNSMVDMYITLYSDTDGQIEENTALKRKLADREWQDIEVAPRDGSIILVPSDDISGYEAIRWGVYDSNDAEEGWFCSDYSDELSHSPKYWIPIPNLPEGDK